MKDAWLSCMITPGQFSCEYAVEGVMHNSEGFSLFACDYNLTFRSAPTIGERVQGWIQVEVLQTSASLALVRLPQSTMENGDVVTVNLRDLTNAPSCVETVR